MPSFPVRCPTKQEATACLPVAKHAVYVEVDRGKCMCSMYTYRIIIHNSGNSASRNQNKDLSFWKTTPEHEPLFARFDFSAAMLQTVQPVLTQWNLGPEMFFKPFSNLKGRHMAFPSPSSHFNSLFLSHTQTQRTKHLSRQ